MTDDKKQRFGAQENRWKNVEVVRPGEEFLLFDTRRNSTQVRYSDDRSFAGIRSSIRLDTGFLGKLNISIATVPYIKERYAVLTPFDPKQGYLIDRDDLSLQSRLIKISRMRREHAGTIEGLYLFVYVAYEDILSNGLAQALLQEDVQEQESEKVLLLRHLFLTLQFPDTFTARAQFNTPRGFLLFRTFFPADTGPLPRVGSGQQTTPGRGANQSSQEELAGDRTEGFDLLLPFDLEKVKTIQARFLFLPDLD